MEAELRPGRSGLTLGVDRHMGAVLVPPPLPPPPPPHTHTHTHSITTHQDTVFEDPVRKLSAEEEEEMGLKYYDSDIHKAAFTLPRFTRKVGTVAGCQ